MRAAEAEHHREAAGRVRRGLAVRPRAPAEAHAIEVPRPRVHVRDAHGAPRPCRRVDPWGRGRIAASEYSCVTALL